MAKTVGISKKRAKLLNRLVRYLKVEHALELGTSLGIGTVAMAAGNPVRITTIEGCPETAAVAEKNFKKFGLKNIDLRVQKFEEFLVDRGKWTEESFNTNSKFQIPNSGNSKSSFDLIYFDGNHQKEATLDYFEKLLPTAHNDSVFIFDDIHWSPEMEEAWEEIKKHPAVKVTIDTFFWGFVFFRKEQEKEHFVIRI